MRPIGKGNFEPVSARNAEEKRRPGIAPLVALAVAQVLLSPYLLLRKLLRHLRKRAGDQFDLQRWTCPWVGPAPTEAGPRVLLVGASLGELRIIERLSAELSAKRPDVAVVWAAKGPSALAAIRARNPNQAMTRWPFGFAIPMLAMLRRVRPKVVATIEAFWHENLVLWSAQCGASVVALNARPRVPQRRFRAPARWFHRKIARGFRLVCFQTESHRESIASLLSPDTETRIVPNLKLGLADVKLDGEIASGLSDWLHDPECRPLLVAGSTSAPAEDRFVLDAFESLNRTIACRLLIAPRRPDLSAHLYEELRKRGLSYGLRSDGTRHGSVWVLDTLGELSSVYRFGVGSFVGGTLSGKGHNILEPLAAGIPVAFGPKGAHFAEIQRLAIEFDAGFRVQSPAMLAGLWEAWARDESRRSQIAENGRKLLELGTGAIDKAVQAILDLLDA